MDVSVIIVNYNTTRLTEQCIASVIAFTTGVAFEIIVVDNASPDRSIENITDSFPQVQLLKSPVNAGFGNANNKGIRASKGEFVFLLNSDTELTSNAISSFLAFMRQPVNNDVAVCGGELYTGTSKRTASFGNFPGMLQAFSSVGFFYLYKSYYRRHIDTGVENYDDEVKNVDFISGADMFIRRSVLDETGLFDESFFLYFEETELSYRIRQKSYRCVLFPSVKIIHYEGSSSGNGSGAVQFNYDTYRYYAESRQLFFRKVYGRVLSVAVKPFFITGTILRSLAGKEGGLLSRKLAILLAS
jgi:GT2 family glycosyltransferase